MPRLYTVCYFTLAETLQTTHIALFIHTNVTSESEKNNNMLTFSKFLRSPQLYTIDAYFISKSVGRWSPVNFGTVEIYGHGSI